MKEEKRIEKYLCDPRAADGRHRVFLLRERLK